MSLVDKNFDRAKDVNAILTQKFFFRTNIFDEGEPKIEELSLDQIFFGKEASGYPGILVTDNNVSLGGLQNLPK
jgi:hypothetical protein